jgi:hypothetical protein
MARNRKTKTDNIQDKRIAKLERQFPTINKVISNFNSKLFNDTTTSSVVRLTDSGLDNEKVDLRGYKLRTISTKDPPDNSVVRYRVMLFIYKCNVDNSTGAATITEPVVNDILNHTIYSDLTMAHLNPDNLSRIRVMYDRVHCSDQMITNIVDVHSQSYKKVVSFMPLIDKAFVLRPFVMVVSGDTSATNKTTVATYIDLLTKQLP